MKKALIKFEKFARKSIHYLIDNIRTVMIVAVIYVVGMFVYSTIMSYNFIDKEARKREVNEADVLLINNYKPILNDEIISRIDSVQQMYVDSAGADCYDFKESKLYRDLQKLEDLNGK